MRGGGAYHKYRYAYLLILPAVLFVFVFSYLPMIGIVIAFKDYNVFDGILKSPWVGMKHFITIFTYPDMLHAIKNTLVYGAVILFGGFPFPILLALMFNELRNLRFKKTVQTIAYMPHIEMPILKLANPNAKVYEVAERVGYKSKPQFVTNFKQYVGMNPKEFQQEFLIMGMEWMKKSLPP